MSKEIKIGLIGAGWMGKAHTTAFHNARMIFGDDMPVFELVSDVSEQAVAKFAKSMGYNRYTTNWMDVVTDPDIDLVDVATPNCMHYFKSDADKDNGRDCGFRTVLLNPQHEGFKWFQPAGGIAIAFDDMKTLQAHALMQAMHGGTYICDFELGAKVDGIISAVQKSVQSGTWEAC